MLTVYQILFLNESIVLLLINYAGSEFQIFMIVIKKGRGGEGGDVGMKKSLRKRNDRCE